jgi:hypothetical protein
LRERYRDDPSTHPDFNPDLWMEVGSSGGPDKNWVYGLSNTTAENLWVTHSVSTVGSFELVSSTQSEEFMALKQQYERLSTDYEQLCQMVMDIISHIGDTCAVIFLAVWSRKQLASSSSSSAIVLVFFF